jgi:hypothetical protein
MPGAVLSMRTVATTVISKKATRAQKRHADKMNNNIATAFLQPLSQFSNKQFGKSLTKTTIRRCKMKIQTYTTGLLLYPPTRPPNFKFSTNFTVHILQL